MELAQKYKANRQPEANAPQENETEANRQLEADLPVLQENGE
jgi:hypothetical protein